MKKHYELPSIRTIGDVHSLTQVNKCGGSGDYAYPQQLNPSLTSNSCPASP